MLSHVYVCGSAHVEELERENVTEVHSYQEQHFPRWLLNRVSFIGSQLFYVVFTGYEH